MIKEPESLYDYTKKKKKKEKEKTLPLMATGQDFRKPNQKYDPKSDWSITQNVLQTHKVLY